MIVEVLAVGTELLLGQIVNSNAAHIGAKLAEAGFDHYHQSVVGDNLDRVAAAIRAACDRSDALIITGGLGPTKDDLTRDAIALAGALAVEFDDEYAEELRVWWESRGRSMPESNLRQAEYPAGAELLANPKGTAPGLRLQIGDTWVFAVPGVPAEMRLMLSEHVLPFLGTQAGEDAAVVVSRLIRTWGESEARIGELLDDLFESSANPTIAFLASMAEIKVRLTAKAPSRSAALALIAPVEDEIRDRLGSLVFGADGETVETMLLDLLVEKEWKLGTAESATGGLIAARLTSIPGSSRAFRGSVVAYDETIKQDLLGVSTDQIADHGVVSEQVAVAMAEGAASALDVDVAIAVTGAAGPTPLGAAVGTMVVAVRTPDTSLVRTLRMPGDRERARAYTTTAALHLALAAVRGTEE